MQHTTLVFAFRILAKWTKNTGSVLMYCSHYAYYHTTYCYVLILSIRPVEPRVRIHHGYLHITVERSALILPEMLPTANVVIARKDGVTAG